MKRKGSALVFSVLMLAFFLALSLNIYFLARKKAERAGVKVVGEKTTNNIDIASSIGYQELMLAASFTTTGFLYDPSHQASTSFSNKDGLPAHSAGANNPLYVDLNTGFYKANSKYTGIQLNNFLHYFSSVWNYDNGGEVNQKLVIGEILNSDGSVVSRSWQSAGVPNKLSYLWNENGETRSLGGYTLIETLNISDPDNPISITLNASNDLEETDIAASYKKALRLNGYSNVDTVILEIQVKETFSYASSGGVEALTNRNISNFIVTVVPQ